MADWVAQKYHSPLPGKKPTASQNQFGTDQVGFLGLGKIAGVSPLTTAKVPTINKAFKNDRLHPDDLRHRPLRQHGEPHPGLPEQVPRAHGLLLLQQDRDRAPQGLRLPPDRDLRQRLLTSQP